MINERKIGPLMRHFKYLVQLGGEVRATGIITALVEGMQTCVNRDDDDNARYLPRHMGYRNCYKQYMSSLGYTNVRSIASGAFIVGEQEDREAEDSGDFVSLYTYCYKWKTSFPKLRVSKPVGDICVYCYAFANRRKYLANRTIRHGDDGGDDNEGNDKVGNEQPVDATDADNARRVLLIQALASI